MPNSNIEFFPHRSAEFTIDEVRPMVKKSLVRLAWFLGLGLGFIIGSCFTYLLLTL